MNEMARVHIFVKGLVQGVFFRANTQKMAKDFGLNGWVKNTPEGGVEAVFEGEKEKIEELLQWAKRGPQGARVDGIDIKWEEYQEEFKNFEIRYL
jgi:acylphosphatase